MKITLSYSIKGEFTIETSHSLEVTECNNILSDIIAESENELINKIKIEFNENGIEIDEKTIQNEWFSEFESER